MTSTVTTDKLDYSPGSSVYINTGGFGSGTTVRFTITNLGADGICADMPDGCIDGAFSIHTKW